MMRLIGTVYKITNTKNDEIYVGSTCEKINIRFRKHCNQHCNKNRIEYNNKLYTSMRQNGIDNYSIHEIEVINVNTCEDKIKLLKLEQVWIDELNSCLNTFRAYTKYPRGSKELNHIYYKASKENQTEESKEKQKEYVKEWHTENKEHIINYKAELYLKQKIKIQEKNKNSPLVLCPCSTKQFKEMNRGVHNKSITHKKYMSTLST